MDYRKLVPIKSCLRSIIRLALACDTFTGWYRFVAVFLHWGLYVSLPWRRWTGVSCVHPSIGVFSSHLNIEYIKQLVSSWLSHAGFFHSSLSKNTFTTVCENSLCDKDIYTNMYKYYLWQKLYSICMCNKDSGERNDMAIIKTFLCFSNTRVGTLICGCYTLVRILLFPCTCSLI